MTNKERFLAEYTRILSEDLQKRPTMYRYTIENVPRVASAMVDGLACGCSSNEGYAVKATCKALGIGKTYKAIEAYLKAVEG